MTRNRFALGAAFVALLVLLWATGGAVAGPPLEGPEGDVSIAATAGSKISYQGVLKENGNPVTGSRDMTFRLYSDDTCSTQVGGDILKSGVQVTSGLFSVDLDVDHSDFNGQGLWLEVEVGGTKIGCEEILPAPYALSLRPGAVISDTTSYVELNRYYRTGGMIPITSKYGVYAKSEGGSLFNPRFGLYGSSSGPYGYGVVGDSDSGYGVYGQSSTGAAIYAQGDAKQNLAGNGLVKAAVFAYCHSSGSTINRYFNNVNSNPVTITNGSSAGECTIDFDFDISDRYWVATAVYFGPRFVTCQKSSSSDNKLVCYRFSADGHGQGGDIMVLVY